MANRPVVLISINYYLPGYKSGGPVRTLASMVEQLGDDFEFRAITRDRDEGDSEPYENCRHGTWQSLGNASVRYLSPKELAPGPMARLLNETKYDLLYLNSFFAPTFTITPLLLRRLRAIRSTPVVLAPRGEFSPNALKIKQAKKVPYIAAVKIAGLYRDVTWQASSEFEQQDIRRVIGRRARIVIAPDMRPLASAACSEHGEAVLAKRPGEASLVFLSRISPKKNLDGALQMLAGIRGRVQFDIYGPEEDRAYWTRCRALIAKLPRNVRVEYRGPVPYDNVHSVLSRYHLFLFPTLGENFGHVILEALLAGCPVMISDQTPWRNLDQTGAGWDLPLSRPEAFQAALQKVVDMEDDEFRRRSRAARACGEQSAADPTLADKNRHIFYAAIDGRRRAA